MHTVHGLIRKAPFIKQVTDATMFVVELSEMVKDRQTGEKHYANYKAMLFAKSPAAIEYYTNATAEGSFIVISAEKLKVESREHNGKTYIALMMDNARIEGAHFNSEQPQGQGLAPQAPAAPQPIPPAPQPMAPQPAPVQQVAPQQVIAATNHAQPQVVPTPLAQVPPGSPESKALHPDGSPMYDTMGTFQQSIPF